MEKKYFCLYSNCLISKGNRESLIIDLQRYTFYHIPNLLCEVLDSMKGKSIIEVKKHFNDEFDKGIDAYMNYLIENELGFYTDEPESFPNLDLCWYSPLEIQSCVIEIQNIFNYDIDHLIKQLNELGCASLQIRVLENCQKEVFENLYKSLEFSRIKTVEILIHRNIYDESLLKYLNLQNSRFFKIIVFGISYNDNLLCLENKYVKKKRLIFTTKDINSSTPDVININNFCIDIKFYSESQAHNVGLNRKVSISADGSIRNYLSHDTIFGNINYDTIASVLKNDSFKSKWFISNEKIDKCCECQYKNMCLNNSDIILGEDNIWRRLNLCSFDPFLNKWNDV